LLHALVGYDARPSAAQLGSYLAVLALIFFGNRLLRPRPQTAR
jgi:high-affinity iron transporter